MVGLPFTITWNSQGFYSVSIPNYEGGEVVTVEDANAAIAAAVQAEQQRGDQRVLDEREANCASVCAICAGKFPDYGKAELIGGLWEHRITKDGICYRVQPCDAAAIRACNGRK